MTNRNKIFIPALVVFLLVVGGIMLFKSDGEFRLPSTPGAKTGQKVILPPNEDDRFKKAVSFSADGKVRPDAAWVPGKVKGMTAFLDNETQLVWSAMLNEPILTRLVREDLDKARTACAQLAPAGRWVLPLRAEMDTAKSHGIMSADPLSAENWMSYYHVGGSGVPTSRRWAKRKASKPAADKPQKTYEVPPPIMYRVRCVARAD